VSKVRAYAYQLRTPREPLTRVDYDLPSPAAGDVVVEIAGCGLCHTDLSFFTGDVAPRKALPLVLGHEISGTIVDAGPAHRDLVGRAVVVPAVLPCGACDVCRRGRGNACRKQLMPGNDFDGGFASHIVVPGRFVCPVPPDTGSLQLRDLSVIADAVATPFQALKRSRLQEGDVAVVVGVGGIGIYMVQVARSAGGRVVAIDVDDRKLETARRMGAEHGINARGRSEGDVRKAVKGWVDAQRLPAWGWKVFETSGTAAGQLTAYSLLTFAGTLGVVGFTMDKVNVRLSNVMAFDADIFGNWGCLPEYYPAIVRDVLAGRINVRDNIETHPLDSINDVIPLALEHRIERRVVFVP
jgi:6-hydroxycyclohex-1-ene-1-carbonyl-CoA dehydrogenase